MSEALDRLTASVSRVASDVSTIADQIRNHPAASDDSGQLSGLADQLDSAATALEGVTQTVSAPAAGDTPVAQPQTGTDTTTGQ